MHYIELVCNLDTNNQELLSAYLISGLGEIGYETFDETENVLKAYIPETGFKQDSLKEVINDIPDEFGKVIWTIEKIEQQNWNAEWEKNFNPVLIDEQVLIKASFHNNLPDYPYEIHIDPKMSFGTGHHSTTALMIKNMLNLQFNQKDVLDMGCGTGVLAILARKLGASAVTAIDIDEWAVENARENFSKNSIYDFNLINGEAHSIKGKFDIILANINRNILINDMPAYAAALKEKGILLISGIYQSDLEQVRLAAEQCNLHYHNHLEKNDWVSAKFVSR
jgi:ribosomal protein L11 methyltransferase